MFTGLSHFPAHPNLSAVALPACRNQAVPGGGATSNQLEFQQHSCVPHCLPVSEAVAPIAKPTSTGCHGFRPGERGEVVAPRIQNTRMLCSSVAHARTVRCSMRFSLSVCTMRSTKMPGVWMSSGLRPPRSTISSTSATVTLPHVATMGLKLRAVFR